MCANNRNSIPWPGTVNGEFCKIKCYFAAGGVDVVKGVAGTVGVGGEMVVFFGNMVGTVEDGEGGVAGTGGDLLELFHAYRLLMYQTNFCRHLVIKL